MKQLDLDALLSALQLGETQDWEFKSAKGGFPKSFWETYSAMANSEGGTIVLGVAERDKQAVADGLSEALIAQYQKVLRDGAHNKLIVNRDILSVNDIEVVFVEGVKLIVVRIARANRTDRPIHVGQSPFGNTYRRGFEGDYHCDDAEVRRMLSDADPIPADHRILKGFTLADIDAQSLAQYRLRMLAAKGEHPWLALPDKEFLAQLGGWRIDRSTGEEGLTLAGLLMFGKAVAILDPEAAPGFFVDYRERLDPVLRYTDRLYPDGTWEANLFQFYQRALPKIMGGVPTPFVLEGVERRDVTPAHEALREAIVNAIIHCDYRGEGGIVFERYPDQFLVENPGTLLVSLEQYHEGGTSECRNKALQRMFLLLGSGEHAGSGVARIKQGWASRHWRSPSLRLTSHPDRVRLALPMVSLLPEPVLAGLRELYGDEVDKLASAELQALATAFIERRLTNARLQELVDLHPADLTRLLRSLCDRGYLVSDNKRRWTSYRLTAGKGEDSGHMGDDSGHMGDDSGHEGEDSGHKDLGGDLADADDKVLAWFAEPVASSARADPNVVQATIEKLCQNRFLSADDIGRFLHRDSENIQKRYLRPMVRMGLLELRYPESRNRPDQAYRAVRSTGIE
jgi:ATP-dependent DNA helicase RecG